MTAPSAFPVYVLTGFLGSGKTTLLASLLAHPGMGETAVVINELGEVALDHLLVREVTEEVMLLGSGCVCCTVRDDLVSTLQELGALREAGSIPAFSRVVVETTGLADPAPIVQALLGTGRLRGAFRLTGIVATVDAVLGARELDEHSEALKQAAIADCLVITKMDAAPPDAAARLRARLGTLNPGAALVESAPGAFPAPERLFGAAGFHLDAKPEAVKRWIRDEAAHGDTRTHDAHRHDERVGTFAIRIAEPLKWASVLEWLELLLAARGESVLRVKGLINVAGRAKPTVLQGVQHIVYPPAELAAWPDADRSTRLVFVTRDLTRSAVETSLRQVLGTALTLS
ncbi:MAG: GTP-binding protein [Betaproteobacteria bacterium]|nr:GTP-binding protein [Betaproteobacteria bacterium]